jgi:hypothetical protein
VKIAENQTGHGYATVRYVTGKIPGKRYSKIESDFSGENHALTYAPDFINTDGKRYTFNYPLRSLLKIEEGWFVIQNEQLDLFATGKTEEEAIADFNEEFNYLFQSLNSMTDDKLTRRLIMIKSILNDFVKSVS